MKRQPAHISLIDSFERATTHYYQTDGDSSLLIFNCASESIQTTEFPSEQLPAMCERIETILDTLPERPCAFNRTKKVRAKVEALLFDLRSRLDESKPETK